MPAAAIRSDYVRSSRPFAVARCISDEAGHTMPPAIRVAMRPDGGVNGVAMLRSLMTHPGQMVAFVSATTGFLSAMRSLGRGAAAIVAPSR